MPVLAIVGAGAALFGGGAAAIGAVIAGTATLATTLTAVAAIGATLGAIGAVTGDKTLSTIGMVTGAIGGIGALAANVGLFGASATTESLFGPSSTAASGADASLTASGEAALQTAGSNAGAEAAVTVAPSSDDILSSLGAYTGSAVSPTDTIASSLGTASGDVSSLLPKDVSDLISSAGSPEAGSSGNLDSIAPGTTGTPANASMINGSSASAMPPTSIMAPSAATPSNPAAPGVSVPGTVTGTVAGSGASGTPADQPGFFSKLISSPAGQLGLVQAGGSLISGLFDTLKPAQVDALNAQASVNRAAAKLSTTQQANMAQPIPVATRVAGPNVTGAPNNGMINSQPAVSGIAA